MIQLTTTSDDFEELHQAIEGRVKVWAKVRAEAIEHLLIDHSMLIRELNKRGIRVTEPPTGKQK